jgi:hypothetical protein
MERKWDSADFGPRLHFVSTFQPNSLAILRTCCFRARKSATDRASCGWLVCLPVHPKSRRGQTIETAAVGDRQADLILQSG